MGCFYAHRYDTFTSAIDEHNLGSMDNACGHNAKCYNTKSDNHTGEGYDQLGNMGYHIEDSY